MKLSHLKHQYVSIIGSKTMGSLSFLLSANVLNAVIGFVTSVCFLRYVDIEIIAVIYPLISILNVVGYFGDFGLTNSFVKLAGSTFKNDNFKSLQFFNAAFRLKLILSVLILIIGIPLSRQIAIWTFGQPIYIEWVRLMIVVTSIQILASYATSALQVEGKFAILSIVKVVPSLLKMFMIAIVVWLGVANMTWNFWAFALVPISTFFIAFAFTDKKALIEIKSTPEQFSELFHVSKWIALSALANSFLGQADVLMTRSMGGVDELARLAGGQKLASMMTIFSISISTVMLPKVASMNDKKELNFFFRKIFLFVLPIGIACLCLLPLSKYVIPFILGNKYESSIAVFNIYMVAHILGLMVSPHSVILYKLNKEPYLASMNIIQLILTVGGNFLLIPEYGAVGAAIVCVLTKVLAIFMIYYQLWKEGIIRVHE